MSYFSRLTDIVTCNLSELLAQAADPKAALEQILREMDEGLAGARRSVSTATANEDRLSREIDAHRQQSASWAARAKDLLVEGQEANARQALLRKREVEDLIAGLQQQHQSAIAMREHLATMQRAIEARHAEAVRRREELGGVAATRPEVFLAPKDAQADDRLSEVDAELEALKRELQG
jgi:phage shock protein A